MLSLVDRIEHLWKLHEHIIGKNSNIEPGSDADLSFIMLGICGEAGEAANILKKILRGDPVENKIAELREEIVDIYHYLLIISKILNMDIETESDLKLSKLYKKWEF